MDWAKTPVGDPAIDALGVDPRHEQLPAGDPSVLSVGDLRGGGEWSLHMRG
jgi:hypothetical protein